MSSTESKLMWVAIALSLLLVLALGTLAVYSVLDRGGGDDADGTEDPAADSPADEQPPASPDLVVGEIDPPARVGCGPSDSAGRGYRLIITNRGIDTVDYLVAIELALSGAQTLVATTEVPGLGPGQQREVMVNAAGPGGRRITDCSIAAVQSDRRILLANS